MFFQINKLCRITIISLLFLSLFLTLPTQAYDIDPYFSAGWGDYTEVVLTDKGIQVKSGLSLGSVTESDIYYQQNLIHAEAVEVDEQGSKTHTLGSLRLCDQYSQKTLKHESSGSYQKLTYFCGNFP